MCRTTTLSLALVGFAVVGIHPASAWAQAPIRWQERPDAGDGTVTIFADGTARSGLTDNSEGLGGAGSGALGARLDTEHWAFRVNVNAAASSDSVSDAFGGFLLNPSVGTTSGALDVLYFRDDAGRHAIHGNVVFGSTEWVRPAEDTLPRLSSTASLWGGSVNYLYAMPAHDDEDNVYSVQFYFGVQHRAIGGDISDESDLRLATLRTDQTSFWGAQFGADVSLRNVTAGIRASYLGDPEEGQVNGLTGLQLSFIVNLNGPIASFPVTRVPS